MVYKKRIQDETLQKKLRSAGAVLIEGPKWCGKTTTAEQIAQSVIYMNEPGKREQYQQLIDLDPERLLSGEVPKLIDEWQEAPQLWDSIRFAVDHRNQEGQFILTGSAVPADRDSIKHSGTGRFSWMLMRPMTLYESADSSGEVSLKNLFEQPSKIYGTNNLDLNRISFLCCRGGWPRTIFQDDETALYTAQNYYDAVVNEDITRVDGKKRDSSKAVRVLRSYARNLGQQVSDQKLLNDICSSEPESMSIQTLRSYLQILESIFVIEEAPAWNPNLRSKTAVRTSDTRYFVDPSLAAAALGTGPNDLINDLKTFGFIFESLCIRDLRVYAESLDGKVSHYRDKSGLECDAIVHLRNGNYGLVEIKLGGNRLIEEGCASLKKLETKIAESSMKKPSFMMVLTGTDPFAYRRKDGVYVVPIGCLKN